MRHYLQTSLALTFLFATGLVGSAAEPQGLGDPGTLQSIQVEPNLNGQGIAIRSKDARQQLFVTGVFSSGQLHDFTRKTTYTTEPTGIVTVSSEGMVTPLADGDVKVIAKSEGKQAETLVKVTGFAQQTPINFKNQIAPVFTKLGCNSGGCHGKSGGQNGFALSLLGFYPEDDYEFLVKEARGRRLFPASPGASLLLTKPVGQSPHGGGKRTEVGSYEYRMIYRWIEQGMPYGSEEDAYVTGIRCLPEGRVMDRGSDQQITVVAEYSDGTTEDVTRMALYEANDSEMAEVTEEGVVKTLDLAGEVAIMARYQGQVATFRATIPLGAPTESIPPPNNYIDENVFAKLNVLGIPASDVCDDATFLRRVSIDITGGVPSESEVKAFLDNADPDKRAKAIDQLLESPAYADYFANKWNLVLRNKNPRAGEEEATFAFYRWIWDSVYENKPYDEFVSELLTASGNVRFNPPVVWYRQVATPEERVEDTAQLFLGLRIQCARCHHHPFEKWSQNDYYSFKAFFNRIGTKNQVSRQLYFAQAELFHNVGIATDKNPRSGATLKPAGLGSEPFDIPDERDPRAYLADWMSSPENPFFAKAVVNRYWKHFFSRGIVEPEDDMRETNPPSNPELLNALADNFIKSGFDMKQLVRSICNSKTYQLSSLPNEYNLKDKQNFSRYYPKRLTAEVLYDAFHDVTATTQGYSGLPTGTRAIQLPDPGKGPYFLKVFGQPAGDTACECERSQEANLAQALHLLNSSEVQNKISSGSGRAAMLAKDKERTHEEKLHELYRWVFSRNPRSEELSVAVAHIQKHEESPQIAYEDILWALINSKEFLFNH
ncbi:MAG: DUF1553 domain-containing protein [Planctomycetaceae bacterium]|jgi:hypothetical protein|nr:DUF1553 domain-containing protein [Planctomycetaceae bacterium]